MSDEHRQTSFAPEALKAAIISSRLANPSLDTASIPPTSKKFFANSVRAVKSESLPRLARNTFGRAPVAASARSEASRNCLERLGETNARQRRERRRGPRSPGRVCGAFEGRHVQHMHRVLVNVGKLARAGERIAPPRDVLLALRARRRDMLLDQARLERRRGTAGLLDLLKLRPCRRAELRRQILDPAGAGRRVGDLGEVRLLQQHELGVARDAAREAVRQADAEVKGRAVIASAPPSPAANTAIVVRRMFTAGSRRVIIRHAVSAATKAGTGVRPQACSTRAQSFRMARNFAMVRNWSASAARRK